MTSSAPTRAAPSAPAPAAPAPAARCRATPSTVYGSEPVTFSLETSAAGNVDVTLLDQQGRSVIRTLTPAPGIWRAPELPSGDFFLRIGQNEQACSVTVNRELSRATQPTR